MQRTSLLLSIGAAIIGAALAAQQRQPQLPAPSQPKRNPSRVIPRPEGALPKVPDGFTVSVFVDNLEGARLMEYAPNGDLFVSQPSANSITVLRDTNNNGTPDTRNVYVQGPAPARRGGPPPAPAAGAPGAARGAGAAAPPAGASPAGAGQLGRGGAPAQPISAYNADGTGFRIYASGLRNPTALAWQPGTNTLWTTVNERDNLGDDLVPDYFTSVKDGGFYGWPFCYIGQNYDPIHVGKLPNLVKTAIVPDVLLGAHSAALGATFYAASQFPARYRNGAFVAMHGSWNRSKANGYKVGFVPFQNGKPGPVDDFLTGFVVNDGSDGPITTWGRPVGVTVTRDGSLLVSDDGGNRIWKVSYKKQ